MKRIKKMLEAENEELRRVQAQVDKDIEEAVKGRGTLLRGSVNASSQFCGMA